MPEMKLEIIVKDELTPAMVAAIKRLKKLEKTSESTFNTYNINVSKAVVNTTALSKSLEATEQSASSFEKINSKVSGTLETLARLAEITSVVVELLGFERIISILSQAFGFMAKRLDQVNKAIKGTIFSFLIPIIAAVTRGLRAMQFGLGEILVVTDLASSKFGALAIAIAKNRGEQKLFQATTISMTKRVRVLGKGIDLVGDSLQEMGGIANTVKGLALSGLGNTMQITADIADAAGEAFFVLGGAAASLVALSAIDILFKKTNTAIDATTRGIIGYQNRLSLLQTKNVKFGGSLNTGTKELSKTARAFTNARIAATSFAQRGLELTNVGLLKSQNLLKSTRATTLAFNRATTGAVINSTRLGGAFVSNAKFIEVFEKNLGGALIRTSLAAGGMTLLGTALIRTDGIFAKMSGVTLLAFAAAIGGMVFIVKQLLIVVGSLIQAIGDKLTAATEKQIILFAEAESKTFAFQQTIASTTKSAAEAATQMAMWNKFIKETGEATGVTQSNLQALVAETVGATKAFGASAEAQKELIRRSIDLSERAHKPNIDTLTALLNAINGNTQGLTVLGIHLNQTTIAHSELGKEYADGFDKLNAVQKAQVRYNVLLEEAQAAAGFATASAGTYSKALKLQENAMKELNVELGRGAEIINGQVVLGLANATKAFTTVTRPILPLIGFFEALIGRLLQVSGFFLKNILVIGLVVSAYRFLNGVLEDHKVRMVLATAKIPLMNKSFVQLMRSLGATGVRFTSLGQLGVGALQILRKQTVNVIKQLIGLETHAKLTGRAFAGQMVKGLNAASRAVLKLSKRLLLLLANPVVAIVAGIAAVLFILFKALQAIDRETQIFSNAWEQLMVFMKEASPVMEFLKGIFQRLAFVMKNILGAVINQTAANLIKMAKVVVFAALAVAKFSNTISGILPGAAVASQKTIKGLEDRLESLGNLANKFEKKAAKNLKTAFSSTAFAADQASRSIAALKEKALVEVAKSAEKAGKKLEALKEKLELFKGLGLKLEIKAEIILDLATEEKRLADLRVLRLKAGADNEAINQAILESEKLIANQSVAIALKTAERKAALLEGGGAAGDDAQLQLLKAQQAQRTQILQRERATEFINQQQFEQSMTAMKIQQIEARNQLEFAKATERAELLGISEGGIQARLENATAQAEREQEILELKLERSSLSEQEKQISREEAEANHQANIMGIKQSALDQQIARDEAQGKSFDVLMGRIRKSQLRNGKILGTIQAVQQSAQFGALQSTLNESQTLMSTSSKKQFKLGKSLAIASAGINGFLAAVNAIAAMSVIPIVGPALGIAFAAIIATATAIRISKIKATKFNPQGGGQADEGLESVPRSLGGRTFLLRAGEAILSPEQNKDVREASEIIIKGGGGNTFNFTFNINGTPSEEQKDELKQIAIDAVREATERGEPVINAAGIVTAS